MSATRKWLILHLTILWTVWELVAAFDQNRSTWPLTQIVITYLPWWVYMPAAVVLAVWLPWHFWTSGRRHLKEAMMVSEHNLDPDAAPMEPLVSRAAVVAVATAALALAVKLGLPIDDDTKNSIVTIVGVVAPIVLAWWARKHVYAPATVAKLLAAKKAGDPPAGDL